MLFHSKIYLILIKGEKKSLKFINFNITKNNSDNIADKLQLFNFSSVFRDLLFKFGSLF